MAFNKPVMSVTAAQVGELETSRVLKNTYMLLGLTLLFSAFIAGAAMVAHVRPLNPFLVLIGFYGLSFWVNATRNSGTGLIAAFALTGFMGYTLGPILGMVMQNVANGSEIIMAALAGTGFIFFGLSAYVLTTRRDLSFMTGFMVAGTVVGLVAAILGLFTHFTGLQLMISAFFMLLSAGWILWTTSAIIHGGERNYISATVMLYVQIYNLFLSLLQLLMAFSGREK